MAEAKIRITAVDDATAVINRVTAGLQGLASPLGAIGGFAAAAGLTAIVTGLRDMIGALDDLDEAAQGLGVTAKELAELRAAAQQSGAGAADLDKALTQLNIKIAQAAGGNKDAIAAFKALGIAFQEAGKARNTIDVLGDFAEKFKQFEANGQRAAFIADFLGVKFGPRLAAYFAQGREGLRLNIGVTDELVEKATRAQRKIDELANAFQRMRNAAADSAVFEWLTDYAINIGKLVESGRFWEIYWKGGIKAVKDFKRELEDAKVKEFFANLNDPNFRAKQSLDNLLPKVNAPDLEAEKRAREAAEKLAKELAEAQIEYREWVSRERERIGKEEGRRTLEALTRQVAEENAAVDAAFDERQARSKAREDAEKQRGDAYAKWFERNYEEGQKFLNLVDEIGSSLESAFGQMVAGQGMSLSNLFKTLAADVLQFFYKLLILQPILNAIKSSLMSLGLGGPELLGGPGFSGPRAAGGPVSSGRGYLVGEQGPEFFVPSVSGTIIPNGAMGGVTIVQNVSVDARSDIASVRAAMAAAKNQAVYEVQQQMVRRGALARA